MRNFFAKLAAFIRDIRRSDDRTKKRWLVIFSGVTMFLVIILWVAYLNVTLPQNAGVSESTSTADVAAAPAAPADNGGSFFDTLGLGWRIVWSQVQNGALSITNSFQSGWNKVQEQVGRTNTFNINGPATTSTPAGN